MPKAYQAYVEEIFRRLKAGDTTEVPSGGLPVLVGQETVALLKPVTAAVLESPEEIGYLTQWRQENQSGFPEKFTVTRDGTKRWAEKALLAAADRMLFWLQSPTGEYAGHLGLFRFAYDTRQCEVDSIVRGRRDMLPGVMTPALHALMDWAFMKLDVAEIYLKVLSENERAIRLYDRTGYARVRTIPLYEKELADGSLRWTEDAAAPGQEPDRFYTVMRCSRPSRLGPVAGLPR